MWNFWRYPTYPILVNIICHRKYFCLHMARSLAVYIALYRILLSVMCWARYIEIWVWLKKNWTKRDIFNWYYNTYIGIVRSFKEIHLLVRYIWRYKTIWFMYWCEFMLFFGSDFLHFGNQDRWGVVRTSSLSYFW